MTRHDWDLGVEILGRFLYSRKDKDFIAECMLINEGFVKEKHMSVSIL